MHIRTMSISSYCVILIGMIAARRFWSSRIFRHSMISLLPALHQPSSGSITALLYKAVFAGCIIKIESTLLLWILFIIKCFLKNPVSYYKLFTSTEGTKQRIEKLLHYIFKWYSHKLLRLQRRKKKDRLLGTKSFALKRLVCLYTLSTQTLPVVLSTPAI